MKEEKIIRLFLENGFQLSKSALNIVPPDPMPLISELKKIRPRPFIVTDDRIKRILNTSNFKPVEVKTIKKFIANKTPLRVDDYVERLWSRYKKIKTILIEQMVPERLVSINKITPRTIKFSIVGLVRKKGDNFILIEDPTGEINLYFDQNIQNELDSVLLDDVVGIQCEKIKEKYYAKKLIYPDVLSSRNITKTEKEILISFVSSTQNLTKAQTKKLADYLSKTKNISAVFFLGPSNSHFLTNIPVESNFIQVPLEPVPRLFQLDAIKILIIPDSFLNHYLEAFSSPEVFTSMLKRRELIIGPSHILNAYEDFVLDEVPDIIISNYDRRSYLNYKGTTIISNSDPQTVFTLNLKTRDVQQISL